MDLSRSAKRRLRKKKHEMKVQELTQAPVQIVPAIVTSKLVAPPAGVDATPIVESKDKSRPETAETGLLGKDWQLVSPLPLIDIGANLASGKHYPDVDAVLERAMAAGLSHVIITGTSLKVSMEALELAGKKSKNLLAMDLSSSSANPHPKVFCTVGVHPHSAKFCNEETMKQIESLALKNRSLVVAIGETGLDYNAQRMFSPAKDQEKWFVRHLHLAHRLHLPLFLHERDAHGRFLSIIDEFLGDIKNATPCPNMVVHCFTGSIQQLQTYLERGLYIGFTGFICMKRGEALMNAVKAKCVQDSKFRSLLLSRVMVETDCPFMTPTHLLHSTRLIHRNEPCTLPLVVRALAAAVDMTVESVSQAVTSNTLTFFPLLSLRKS